MRKQLLIYVLVFLVVAGVASAQFDCFSGSCFDYNDPFAGHNCDESTCISPTQIKIKWLSVAGYLNEQFRCCDGLYCSEVEEFGGCFPPNHNWQSCQNAGGQFIEGVCCFTDCEVPARGDGTNPEGMVFYQGEGTQFSIEIAGGDNAVPFFEVGDDAHVVADHHLNITIYKESDEYKLKVHD